MTKLLVAAMFLAMNFYTYHYLGTGEVIPPRVSLERFPLQLGEWRCPRRETMGPDVERNLGVTDYVVCSFTRVDSAEAVGVYVGYHAMQVRREGGGSGENMIHPPAHCLPGSGWDIIASEHVPLDLPGLPGAPAEVNRLVIAKGDSRQLVYYWYQERGKVIAQDWKKILTLFWDRATTQRSDGSLVRFTVPLIHSDDAQAEAAFRDLAAHIVPLLPTYVPN
jgi:EpsI family protein